MIEEQLINYAINNSFAIVVALILLFRTEKVIKQNTEAIYKLTVIVEKMSEKLNDIKVKR